MHFSEATNFGCLFEEKIILPLLETHCEWLTDLHLNWIMSIDNWFLCQHMSNQN